MALNPRGRYMRCLRRVITTWIRRYPSPGRFKPCARAYSTTLSSLHPVGTVWVRYRAHQCRYGPLRFHGTATSRAQGCVVGRDEGSGGKQERRRIGK